ncbi:hypothetical protein MNBD_NITROSPINAE03-1637 [hydrothermal vent metagenome]|uniref:SHOCT domain-containing protein n=1 Tax=hydrothermal vent metagenome TaxID=652676 RepID=A0A3B1C479_9ZZZZ
MMDSGMMQGMGMMSGYGMFFGMFFWILLSAGVIALVLWAVQKTGNTNNAASAPPQETAMDILKKRFARGEIDKDEYEEKKKTLQ